MTTLRLHVTGKQEWGTGEDRTTSLSLTCDYADGRNKEWSRYTPSATLQMTVKGHIGDEFDLGNKVEVSLVVRKEDAAVAAEEAEEAKDGSDSPA